MITIEMVREAYRKIVASPCNRYFSSHYKTLCCPISALVMSRNITTMDEIFYFQALKFEKLATEIGVDVEYIYGFIRGFDDRPIPSIKDFG